MTPDASVTSATYDLAVDGHTDAMVEAVDGRRTRRRRNLEAVLDTVVEMYEMGVTEPSTEDVAERAGVSTRSVYRYFATREMLVSSALTHFLKRAIPHLSVAQVSEGELDARIDVFVAERTRIYVEFASLARMALTVGRSDPLVIDAFAMARALMRQHFLDQFAPEVAEVDPDRLHRGVLGALVPFHFHGLEYLHVVSGLDADGITRALSDHLRAHVAAMSATNSTTIL